MPQAGAAGTSRPGWIGRRGSPRPARRATDAGARCQPPRGGRSLLPASNVRIVDATVRYVDERSGASQEVAGIDADLATDETGGALDAKGSLAWMGEKVGFAAKLLAGRQGSGSPLAPRRRPAVRGNLRRQCRARPGAGGRWRRQHQGRVLGRAGAVAWPAARAARRNGRAGAFDPCCGGQPPHRACRSVGDAGRQLAGGRLTVETGGARPHVSGQLQLSELDFGRLLVRSSKAEPSGGAATDAIGDLLQGKDAAAGKAQVRGFTKRSGGKGWSDEIIDLAPLGLADADLALSVDRLVYKNVATGRSRLALAVQDRVAKITLEDVQLYAGRARGVLTLDGRGQTSATTTNLTLDDVSALPLLTDALEFGWLDGRGTIVLALAGRGPLRAADRRDLARQGGAVRHRRGDCRRGYRPGARRYREGAFADLKADLPTGRPSASSAARSSLPTASPRTRTCGWSARICTSAARAPPISPSAQRRLHRAPEDRRESGRRRQPLLTSQAWRCPCASREPGRSRLSRRI